MKPLRARLMDMRERLGTPWEVLERDYLLSWVLAGIDKVPALRTPLVFKGGTALRKCYFGNYRFSEDLDFSTSGSIPTGTDLAQAIGEVCAAAEKLLDDYAPVQIISERYLEKEPHQRGQEAFILRARFPWHREPSTRILIEITIDETILKPVLPRAILHDYGEPLEAQIPVYSLEEIMAEKLRAILQHIEKLRERGWSRSRARDYYDLWRILGAYQSQMDFTGFDLLLRDKCARRKVTFQSEADFFQPSMMAYVEKTWQQWLGPLVPDLPAFETIIRELRPPIAAIIRSPPPDRLPAPHGRHDPDDQHPQIP